MNNQHAGLSQPLATQRITERQEQAAQARLAPQRMSTAPPTHWRLPRAGGNWAAGQAPPPSRPSIVHTTSADRSGGNHPNRARTLIGAGSATSWTNG